MASKKFDKNSSEWNMFVDFWALCQKYWVFEPLESYIDEAFKETNNFCNKYNTEFATDLAIVLMNHIDRKGREIKK